MTNIPSDARKKYEAQKKGAEQRRIDFDMSLEDWWSWWQTDNRWLDRGSGRYQFCMARKGDHGPYAIDNIYCATNAQNCADISKDRRSVSAKESWVKRHDAGWISSRKSYRAAITLTDPQRLWITEMATLWGLSISEAIRRVIDERMSKGGKSA